MKYLCTALMMLCVWNATAQTKLRDTIPGTTFQYVELMPRAPYNANEYLRTHLHYPLSAKQQHTEGRVIVKFAVKEDGHISDCIILKQLSKACDTEALRVVGSMPPWLPGESKGKKVKVWYVLPIVFDVKN
jgi:protein TonB